MASIPTYCPCGTARCEILLKSEKSATARKAPSNLHWGIAARTGSGTAPFPIKSVDVFVGLTLEGGATVRNQGVEQIRKLLASGVVVDFAEKRIAHSEYMERMVRVWPC